VTEDQRADLNNRLTALGFICAVYACVGAYQINRSDAGACFALAGIGILLFNAST